MQKNLRKCNVYDTFRKIVTHTILGQSAVSFQPSAIAQAKKLTPYHLPPTTFPTFAPMNSIDSDLQARWWNLEAKLVERFGKKPDMEAILFLIGMQELGELRNKFTKEQKQDLMHVATCTLLAQSGFYEMERVDEDGWPHFKQIKSLPVMNLIEQENFMKDHVLLYFSNSGFIGQEG